MRDLIEILESCAEQEYEKVGRYLTQRKRVVLHPQVRMRFRFVIIA